MEHSHPYLVTSLTNIGNGSLFSTLAGTTYSKFIKVLRCYLDYGLWVCFYATSILLIDFLISEHVHLFFSQSKQGLCAHIPNRLFNNFVTFTEFKLKDILKQSQMRYAINPQWVYFALCDWYFFQNLQPCALISDCLLEIQDYISHDYI